MFCVNCGGDDEVTYDWSLDSLTDETYMAGIDMDSYTSMDPLDGSLTVDSMGFIHVVTDESFAFVLRSMPFN